MTHLPHGTGPKRYWADLTTREFGLLDRDRSVVMLPVAATEQHGPHLPVSVDTTLVDGIVAATLPLLPADASVLVLPTLAVGKSNEHAGFAGTLSLTATTLINVWMEIGESVARSGFRKLVLLNAHGGQSAVMDIVNHDLRAARSLMVWAVNWYRLGLPEGLFSADEVRFGIHGGAIETSMMLALRPDLVDMGRAADFDSTLRELARQHPVLGDGTSARFGWQAQDLNPSGAIGNAAAATAAHGSAVLAHVSRRLATLLTELGGLPLALLADPPRDR